MEPVQPDFLFKKKIEPAFFLTKFYFKRFNQSDFFVKSDLPDQYEFFTKIRVELAQLKFYRKIRMEPVPSDVFLPGPKYGQFWRNLSLGSEIPPPTPPSMSSLRAIPI